MKSKIAFASILLFGLLQTAFSQDVIVKPDDGRAYLIGPGDRVVGKVLGEEEFNFDAVVDDDGRLQIPFADEGLMAKCRSEKQLRGDVLGLWGKYLKNPQVTVQVSERKSRPPVTIYGEVKQQQQFDLRRETRLLEIISSAGGVTEEAGGLVQVFRTRQPLCNDATEENQWRAQEGDGLEVPSRMFSLMSVKQGRDEANPVILPGDIIVVQKAAPVYFTGEVRQAQGVYIKNGSLSLSQALAMVGGVNREAKTKDIKIYRLKSDSSDREIIAVNYDQIKKGQQKDVMLAPYDIVEVDKTKKSVMQTILEVAVGAAKSVPGSLATGLPTRILY